MSVVIRGIVYFGLVFGAGVILGFIRVLWVLPLVGDLTAKLIEAPFMLAAIYFSARFILQKFKASRGVDYLYSGLVALLLQIVVEFSVALVLERMGAGNSLAEWDPMASAVYVVLLIIFAAMPGTLALCLNSSPMRRSSLRSRTLSKIAALKRVISGSRAD